MNRPRMAQDSIKAEKGTTTTNTAAGPGYNDATKG